MLFNSRTLVKSSSSLIDLSKEVSQVDGDGKAVTLVSGDYLYLGSDLPFTQRYFRLGAVVNSAAGTLDKVEIWDGREWKEAVDTQDWTEQGGKTLARSGFISWVTPKNVSWALESSTENMDGSGLESLHIYEKHWVRISFAGSLTAAIVLKYVGYCFSDDQKLRLIFPDLLKDEVLEAFESGKTDWEDQHILASDEVVRYLARNRELITADQIMNWQRFSMAAAYKCAELAYTAFPSDDLEDMRKRAESGFYRAINQTFKEIDRNEDGHAQPKERRSTSGFFRG